MEKVLFTTTRSPSECPVVSSTHELASVRALEEAWARRIGIADAPFRLMSDTMDTSTQKYSEREGEVVSDVKQDKLPESSTYETSTRNGADTHTDRQSTGAD